MPYNDLLTSDLSGQLQRVNLVLSDLVQSYKSGLFSTREQLLSAYAAVISLYQDTLAKSLFIPEQILADTAPDVQEWNERMKGVNFDLQSLFFEMNHLATLMTGNFNQQVSETDDLLGRIKRISSKLGDYKIITGTGGISFGESFTSTENIDIGSSLISSEECVINTIEGAVTLTETEITILNIESISIDGNNSNGILGNNSEVGIVNLHNDLTTVIDSNPDTWVEYERTSFLDDIREVLSLRLILKLDERTIFNRISIDPVNFGTLDNCRISDIRVSVDGENWVSIVGDLPLASYIGETEENSLVLSPTSTKYTGKFEFTFLPRKVNHIAIDLQQDSGFNISTTNGTKLRQVIAIKSIDISAVKFISNAQLVSKPITSSEPISKVGLLSAYRPINSSLGNVQFDISTDGGTNWSQLQPLTEDDLSSPEIINLDDNINNFIYKLTLTRNDEAFSEVDTFDETEQNVRTIFEHREVNLGASPAIITPSKQMANDQVIMMNAPVGSVGEEGPGRPKFQLTTGIGDAVKVKLPFDIYPKSDIEKSDITVYVHGDEWTRLPDLEALEVADPTDRVYFINHQGFIVFGDGNPSTGNGAGKSPAPDAKIAITLPVEQLFFRPVDKGWLAQTDLPSSGNHKTTILERVSPSSNFVAEVLPQAKTEIRLANNNISAISFQIHERDNSGLIVTGSFVLEVSNLNAVDSTGDYYVDYKRGVIHTFTPTDSTYTTTAVYKYFAITKETDFRWQLDDLDRYSGIFIPDKSFITESKIDISGDTTNRYGFDGDESNISISEGDTLLRTSHLSIVEGTLVLEEGIFGTGIVPTEVTYVNGFKEIHKLVDVQNEIVAATSYSSFPTNHTFTLAGGPNIFNRTGITFSDTSHFATQTPSVLVPGNWSINYSTGEVTVRLSSNLNGTGTASYQIFSSNDTSGIYSVDYKNGLIHTSSNVVEGYKITYEYTKYRIHYPVAINLSSDDVEINVTNNSISISTENLITGKIAFSYQYNTEFDTPLTELVQFYTPLVRDIRFRYLTEGMLIDAS